MNRWVDKEIRYESLQERLVHLVTKNDGIIVLGGGIGTLSELALAWSLLQIEEIPPRPLVLVGELWSDFLSAFVRPEYVPNNHLHLVTLVPTPEEAVSTLLALIPVHSRQAARDV